MKAGRAYAATLAKDLVGVEVEGISYAIEVARIREIVRPLPVIELPHRRPFVLGVAEYRDEVVPVIDLRAFFGLPTADPNRRTKWVILQDSTGLIGIVVDAVLEVFSSAENPQRAVPILDDEQHRQAIKSAYRHDRRLVFLLDVKRLAEPAAGVPREVVPRLSTEAP